MSVHLNSDEPAASKKDTRSYKQQKGVLTMDYASIRNLTQPQKIPELLPGLGRKGQRISANRRQNQNYLIDQPRLLTSAKERIKQLHEQSVHSESEHHSNNLGLSSFVNSREATPINPLSGSLHKRRNPTSQKNKLNSINSQLFDIASNPESHYDKNNRYKHPQFRLFESILGQSDAVYRHVFGRDRTVNPKLIHLWKDCLNHEDKSQIYLPVGEQKVQIPYSHARIYPLNQIQHEFRSIFGTGKNRALTVGEQAILIQSIERYLALCSREPLKIGRKDYDILQNVLNDCKLGDVQNFPMCMKQAEAHFKLLATKWKYSGKLNTKDRIVEAALIMGKNNFLDLAKHNILTQYLLLHSNINDF